MEILAHRGCWNAGEEKNSLVALDRALERGYGIETDIRDKDGKLVISHDIPSTETASLTELFELINKKKYRGTVALNIKSDGLQGLLEEQIKKYKIYNYFVFDMSVPEMVLYKKGGFSYYTRYSDVENECVLYDSSDGVWIDSFIDPDFYTIDRILKLLRTEKRIGIISPEIHEFEKSNVWEKIRELIPRYSDQLKLCTDVPMEAEEYFQI